MAAGISAGAVKPTHTLVVMLALGFGLTSCDDDLELTPRPKPANPARPATPGATGPNRKAQLAVKPHIEDRVSCPIPDKPTDPEDGGCDPKAPSCAEHRYCLPLTQGYFCEPCPERDRIRHVFKERDFAVEQNRDPFQPASAAPLRSTKKCLRDQMVATSYSYTELKLVGIVAQGTQRKVLMMGGPLGYIIKRGDCVGKEKAVVKDIGTGYITFLVDPDTSAPDTSALDTAAGNRLTPEEYSVQLNPKQLAVDALEFAIPVPRAPDTPVVPPPATLWPPPGAGSAGARVQGAPPVEAPPLAPKPR
jgi:hypothetical protein